MNTREKMELQAELNKQGFAIRVDMWPSKTTYYKPDGESMPNLPSDPWSMRRYLRRGFTLAPPVMPTLSPVIPTVSPVVLTLSPVENILACPHCDFTTKTRIALVGHLRKHKKGGDHGIPGND